MNSDQRGMVRIGTSGIVVPGTKQTFPEEFKSGSRLHYYGSLFNTLEINSSFYKIPMATTFAKWATEVPEDFKFTVKLWRGITHAKKLVYSLSDIDTFINAANQLGDKRGCLLIQFPASITLNYKKEVEGILAHLHKLNENGHWQLSVEMRDVSWYVDSVYSMFAKYQASLVLHDMPASATPLTSPSQQSIYLRFHGPTGNYTGGYSDEHLQQYVAYIQEWRKAGKNIYVYFNNTIGAALQNAQDLQDFLNP